MKSSQKLRLWSSTAFYLWTQPLFNPVSARWQNFFSADKKVENGAYSINFEPERLLWVFASWNLNLKAPIVNALCVAVPYCEVWIWTDGWATISEVPCLHWTGISLPPNVLINLILFSCNAYVWKKAPTFSIVSSLRCSASFSIWKPLLPPLEPLFWGYCTQIKFLLTWPSEDAIMHLTAWVWAKQAS